MLYPSSKTHSTRRALYALVFAGIMVAGCVFFDVPFPSAGTHLARSVATPLWAARDALTGHVVRRGIDHASYEEVIAERDALANELIKLRRENYAARALQEENTSLQAVVGRAHEDAGLIATSVILGATHSPYDTFIIDAGARVGVRDGMLVLSPEGVALGFVKKAYEASAVVSLFSASNVRTDVVLVGSSTLHVVLEGKGGSMELRVPRSMTVVEGTAVVVPSFKGALVGTVTYVRVTPEDAFQTVYVGSPDNIYTLRHVLVDTTHTWSAPTTTEPVFISGDEIEEVEDETQ